MSTLALHRHTFTPAATIGTLYGNGSFLCFILEDADRLMLGYPKIPHRTAIPAGIYRLILGQSPRFGLVPFVLGVPDFTEIRMHAGNRPEDTDGCLLTGYAVQRDLITGGFSVPALQGVKRWLRENGASDLQVLRAPLVPQQEQALRLVWQKET